MGIEVSNKKKKKKKTLMTDKKETKRFTLRKKKQKIRMYKRENEIEDPTKITIEEWMRAFPKTVEEVKTFYLEKKKEMAEEVEKFEAFGEKEIVINNLKNLKEAKSRVLNIIKTLQKMEEDSSEEEDEVSSKRKDKASITEAMRRVEEEKLHAYKKHLRIHKERMAVSGDPIKAKESLAIRYRQLIKEKKMTLEGALIMRMAMEADEEERYLMSKLMISEKMSEAIKENNIRFLAKLEKENEARALTVGDSVVACPYPVLWEGEEEAQLANEVMLENVECEKPTLSGGEPKLLGLKIAIDGVFKTKKGVRKATLSKETFEMVRRGGALRGGGYVVHNNEDGTVTIEDVEKAFAEVGQFINYCNNKITSMENEFNNKLQYLHGLSNNTQQMAEEIKKMVERRQPTKQYEPQQGKRTLNCYFCGKPGHMARECYSNPQSQHFKQGKQ